MSGRGKRVRLRRQTPTGQVTFEPPLPLTSERLKLIRAYAGYVVRGAEGSPASLAQAVQSGDPALAPHAPSVALASGICRLIVVLIAVALLPNLTFAAFWLGLIDPPWSQLEILPPPKSHPPSVRSAVVPPVLSAPDTLEAREGGAVFFPMALDGTDGVPPSSIIVIRGLPPGSTLSTGRPQGKTEWNLKPDEIGDLHLTLSAAAGGEYKLSIQLLSPDDGILADAATRLRIGADPKASIATDVIEPGPKEDTADQTSQAMVAEESVGNRRSRDVNV